MLKFILNDETIETNLPAGLTVLDFVRYKQNLKGTKIGCREGDCGACNVLIGELSKDTVEYRSMTSCLMPIANAQGKHVVTVEGINPKNGDLTPVQKALVDENGTQCGFCTVGFVMSMTGFCVDASEKSPEMAVSAIDGNICRCTGYKSIERATAKVSEQLLSNGGDSSWLNFSVENGIVPSYFLEIKNRLEALKINIRDGECSAAKIVVGGGTDLYVQRHDEMVYLEATQVFDDPELRGIREADDVIEIGASATVTDLLESPIMRSIFPDLFKHLKLVSSTPIRNMATLAGNFVNASPIGDMTVWFLALDSEIILTNNKNSKMDERILPLRDLYLGYKRLAMDQEETIKAVRFKKRVGKFNFEKVCKRTYLDIATVNTAISIKEENGVIKDAHVAAGGVSPIPLYLPKTSKFLVNKEINDETVSRGNEMLQKEISPISDVRGSADYKRLLLRQLFVAHFIEMFDLKLKGLGAGQFVNDE